MNPIAILGLVLLLLGGLAAHHFRQLSGDDDALPLDIQVLVLACAFLQSAIKGANADV